MNRISIKTTDNLEFNFKINAVTGKVSFAEKKDDLKKASKETLEELSNILKEAKDIIQKKEFWNNITLKPKRKQALDLATQIKMTAIGKSIFKPLLNKFRGSDSIFSTKSENS